MVVFVRCDRGIVFNVPCGECQQCTHDGGLRRCGGLEFQSFRQQRSPPLGAWSFDVPSNPVFDHVSDVSKARDFDHNLRDDAVSDAADAGVWDIVLSLPRNGFTVATGAFVGRGFVYLQPSPFDRQRLGCLFVLRRSDFGD